MLAIGIRYLTGYAVATDVSDREKPEWPPHPARVFMAMAAALFETGGDPGERAALAWLERQGPPEMRAPAAEPRTVVTHFVPVNDTADPVKKSRPLMALQSMPLGRDRQPRTFPRVRLDDDTAYFLWPDAAPTEEDRVALSRVCEKVTRVGHSSSLVQAWVVEGDAELRPNIVPGAVGEHEMRIATPGTLGYLQSSYNSDDIEQYAALGEAIDHAHAERRSVRGKGASERRAQLDRHIEQLSNERDTLDPHPPLRPTIGRWQTYRRVDKSARLVEPASGAFDRHLMVLSVHDGPVLGLESTWRLLTALRDTILSTCGPVVPEWVSGHQQDGSPSRQAHLALLPLPFVGHDHADGHLMGVALAFPREIEPRERGRALRKLLYDDHGRPRSIRVVLGALGEWMLARDARDVTPVTLQARTWTMASDTWATVTPIVLDRYPKTDRAKDRESWSLEVASIISESCERQGLPAPVDIDVGTTCWHRGGPRAVPGKGSGYPPIPAKEGRSARQQVHAWLRFDCKVEGPLLLGAGRYRGYGLCKPWTRDAR